MFNFFRHINIHILILISLAFLTVFVSACQLCQQGSNLVVHKEYDIITLEHKSDLAAGAPINIWVDSNNHIINKGIRFSRSQYILWDETTAQILDSVNCQYKRFIELNDVTPISKDSFLLVINSVYDNDLNDGVMLIINRNKQIIDTVNVEYLPICTRKHLMLEDNNRHYIFYSNFPLTYTHHKIFVPLVLWDSHYRKSDSKVGVITYPTPPGVNNYQALPITYSAPRRGYYWPLMYRLPRGAISSNALFVLFGNYPYVYKYNFIDDKLKKKKLAFSTIGKIKPYKIGTEEKIKDPYHSRYEEIIYDSINQRIYVIAKVGCDTMDGPLATQDENNIYSFLVLDTCLNTIGEGIIPEGYHYSIIPYKRGFLLFKLGCEYNTYTYFTYAPTSDADYLGKQIRIRRDSLNTLSPKLSKNDAYIAYLRKIVGSEFDNYNHYLLFSESACPHCSQLYQKTINRLRQDINRNKGAIIMVNQDSTVISDFCQSIDGFSPQDNNRIHKDGIPFYSDTQNYYTYFMETWINVLYISLDSSRHIQTVKSIHPGNIEDLDILLNKY